MPPIPYRRIYMYDMKRIFCVIIFFVHVCFVSAQVNDTITIKEVVVTADKRLVKRLDDRIVVDASQIRKGCTSLYDLLRFVPYVRVDGDVIQIAGKEEVKVMFNGRMKNISPDYLVTLLKSYSASSTDKIEIITRPGAKYDSEGKYGILNFITSAKSNYIGGEIADELSYAECWKNDVHVTLNDNTDRLTMTANAGWTYGTRHYTESNDKYYPDEIQCQNTFYTSLSNEYTATAVIDYQLDSMSVLSADVSYIHHRGKRDVSSNMDIVGMGGNVISLGSSETSQVSPGHNFNASIYADRIWSEKKKITWITDVFNFRDIVDANFFSESSPLNPDNEPVVINRFRNHGEIHTHGFSSALDYDFSLPWTIYGSMGVKAVQSRTSNTNTYDYSTLPVNNDAIDYHENIYSGFLLLEKTVSSLNMHVGGRLELTHAKIYPQNESGTTKKYWHFFPDISFSYNLSNKTSLQTGIYGGMERPGLRQMNPFSIYLTQYSKSMGNPTLNPSHYYKYWLEGDFTIKDCTLTCELHYVHDKNLIAQVTEMDDVNTIAVTRWENACHEENWGGTVMLYYGSLRWLRLFLAASANYTINSSNNIFSLPTQRAMTGGLLGNLNFVFDKHGHSTGYLSFTYDSKQKKSISTINSKCSLNCGVNFSLLNERLSLGLRLQNVIANKHSGTSYSNSGMYMTFNNDYNYFTVSLSACYLFGKTKKNKDRIHGSDDVKERFFQ